MASNSKQKRNVFNIEIKLEILNRLAMGERLEYNCDEEDVETWMTCDAEDCGFQMLNDDDIVTPEQEESDPVDDETDEDKNNKGQLTKIGQKMKSNYFIYFSITSQNFQTSKLKKRRIMIARTFFFIHIPMNEEITTLTKCQIALFTNGRVHLKGGSLKTTDYTRAFGYRPRHFEPWSSDEDDT
ncbi:UNVERIFIED_CONTAM: hypothetical protein NCL1_17140 [Trichonephila clavipes]